MVYINYVVCLIPWYLNFIVDYQFTRITYLSLYYNFLFKCFSSNISNRFGTKIIALFASRVCNRLLGSLYISHKISMSTSKSRVYYSYCTTTSFFTTLLGDLSKRKNFCNIKWLFKRTRDNERKKHKLNVGTIKLFSSCLFFQVQLLNLIGGD